MLRPGNVVDVLTTRRLYAANGEELVSKLGAITRERFAWAGQSKSVLPVIIPAKNEAQRLPGTLVAVSRANLLPIVVDNSSTDNTAEIAEQMGAVLLEQPTGKKMAATKRGLEYATHELRAQSALFIDADTLVLPGYGEAMSRRMNDLDTGSGVGVFGSSYRMFGASRVADVVSTLTNLNDNIRRERRGDEPVPRGHNFGLRFDDAGHIEAGIMELPDDLFLATNECSVPDDVAIFRAVCAAGAVVAGCVDPGSFVITENRISSFGQLWAVHKGATWEQVTGDSYRQQYGPQA